MTSGHICLRGSQDGGSVSIIRPDKAEKNQHHQLRAQ
jgi:hypothetical protein